VFRCRPWREADSIAEAVARQRLDAYIVE